MHLKAWAINTPAVSQIMHALKSFLFLTLLGLFALISSSMTQEEQEEAMMQRANKFFDCFEASATEELNQIAMEIIEVEELSDMYTPIVSFPSTVRSKLFFTVYNVSIDEDEIIQAVTMLYTTIIADEFDARQKQSSRSISAHINRFSSNIKDVIFSSIDTSLEDMKNYVYFESVTEPTIADQFISIDDEDLDEISTEIEVADPMDQVDEEDDKENISNDDPVKSSNRSNASKISDDLFIKARSILYYGIEPKDSLFRVAKPFLKFVKKNELKICDPSMLLDSRYSHMAFFQDFDIASPGFQEFCNHMSISDLPITSPLYTGPRKKKDEILKAKRAVLVNLARDESFRINENFSIQEMILFIKEKDDSIDSDIIEVLIEQIRDKITDFLLSFNDSGSFVSGFDEAVKEGCQLAMEIFGIFEDQDILEILVEAFHHLFESPLALLKKSDSVEEWKSFYDETSPSFKFKSSSYSPISEGIDGSSKSSSGKSVTIDEDNNEVRLLSRAGIFGTTNDDESTGNPLKRTASFSFDLSSLDDAKMQIHSIERDPVDELLDLADQAEFDFDSFGVPTLQLPLPQEPQQPVLKQFSSMKIPDFPFEDPVASIEDPIYVKSTATYALENGDDKCFMLEERMNTFNEGLTISLRETFENHNAIESVERIFAKNIRSTFKL